MTLAQLIEDTKVSTGSVAIFWLGQAGFVFKSARDEIIYVDPYLSDGVERQLGLGFKRIMMSPIAAKDVVADLVVNTHEHLDHLDPDSIPTIAQNPRTRFAGTIDCVHEYRRLGIPEERIFELQEGEGLDFGGFGLTAVYADHGELAPRAVGVVVESDGIRIYHAGDTAYCPERMLRLMELRPEIAILPINGAYGNLDAEEAARLAHDLRADVVIPSHFWMFPQHNGDPGAFLRACERLAPEVKPVLMCQAERYIYTQKARQGAQS